MSEIDLEPDFDIDFDVPIMPAPPTAIYIAAGLEWAIDLFWLVPDRGRRLAPVAKSAARRTGEDLVLYRRGFAHQFALSSTAKGHKPGMRAGAAALADEIPGTWVGLFELDRGYWLLTVREGQVLAGGDRWIESLDDALAAVNSAQALGQWDAVIASPGLPIPGARAESLDPLLRRQGRKAPKLQAAEIRLMQLVLLGVFGTFLVGGFLVWYLQPAPPVRLQPPRSTIATPALQPPPPPSVEKPVLPHAATPWDGKIDAVAWSQACESAISRIAFTIPGWDLGPLKCSGSTLSVAWNRTEGGSYRAMDLLLRRAGYTTHQLDAGGSRFSLEVSFPVPDPVDQPVAPPRYEAKGMLLYLYAKLTESGASPHLSIGKEAAPAAVGAAPQPPAGAQISSQPGRVVGQRAPSAPPPPRPMVSVVHVGIDSEMKPSSWWQAINLPGSVCSEITYTPSSGQWSFSGVIYEPIQIQ